MQAERALEKAEKERLAEEVVPVMKLFSHGNTVNVPVGPKIDANSFELKIPLINRVEQNAFAGRATEDAHRHLTRYLEIASTIKQNGVDDDIIRVRLFPFSLIDSANEWYECLPADKVSKWEDIVALFLDKYYPPGTILKLKSEIFQFVQGHDEPLYEALARFKALLRKCPNHGFGVDHQVGILYNGFNEQISSLLDSGANGGFLKKGANEAMEVIKELVANSQSWSKERHSMKKLAAVETDDIARKFAAIESRMERMESPKGEGSEVAVIEDVNYIQNGDPNRSYNNNYRPNQGDGNFNYYSRNRPHPNLSYANNNYIQPPAGFNVSKGGVIEPPKRADRYEASLQKILALLGDEKKKTAEKIGSVEDRLSTLEKGMSDINYQCWDNSYTSGPDNQEG